MPLIHLTAFLLVVVMPAWYLQRWLLRLTRPRESFFKFLTYLLLSLATAFIYTFIFVWALLEFMRPH